MQPLVSIISINYNQAIVTAAMLQSLKSLLYRNIEVIIVDNASTEDPTEIVAAAYPQAILIKSAINLGFSGGNNLGLKRAKGDIAFFINNDTEVTPNLVGTLVDVLLSNPKIGMVTPKIKYFETNIIQYAGSNAINPFTSRGSRVGYQAQDVGQYNYVSETDLPHGAALMVRIETIQKVCMMPEIFFLYYEEHDWAESFKRAGYVVHYVGTAEIFHKESISVGKANPLKTFYLTRNRLLFTKRNTFGLQTYIAFLFFFLLTLPKNLLYFTLKKDWKHAKAFCGGVIHYFKIRSPFQKEFVNSNF